MQSKSGMIKCRLWRYVIPSENCKGWMESRSASGGRSSREPQHWTFSTKFRQICKWPCSRKERQWRFLCLKIKEYASTFKDCTLGILGTWRRKQVVSRICNQSWWQAGSSCFTNGGRFRKLRTHSVNQLCIYGAVTKVVWAEFRRSKPKQTGKCSQDIPWKSNKAIGFQVIGWDSKTPACIGKPNVPFMSKFEYLRTTAKFYHPIEKGNYYVATTLEDDGWRKRTSMGTGYTAPRNREDSRPYAPIDAEKETGLALNTGIATVIDSWHWSTCTITEFPRILRMEFDKSWSREICEWNSSSQLWHCELQFLVAREGRQPQWCVFRIFQTSRGKPRTRLTRFEQC